MSQKASDKQKPLIDSDSDQNSQDGKQTKNNSPDPRVSKQPLKGLEDSEDEKDVKAVQAAPRPVVGSQQPQDNNPTEQQEILEIIVARPEDLNLVDLRTFVMSPPPRGKMVQCTIMRDKTNFTKKFSPKYHVYISVRTWTNK